MTNKNTISIDGQEYDPVTGLPLNGVFSSPEKSSVSVSHPVTHHTSAKKLHVTPMRSHTLHRKAVKRPTRIVKHEPTVRMSDVSPHPNVRRFAPHPVGAITPKKVMDVGHGPVAHPHVVKAHAISAAKAEQGVTRTLPTANQIKESAITNAVANTHHKKTPLKLKFQPRQRVAAVLSATFALVLLGGYLTYLNMPTISVRVAAAQAGINASYPDYHPDGYAMSGPVTYSDNRVSMNFKANAGNQNFTLNQSKSAWNSEAVLDNYVTAHAGSNYIPYNVRGLTVYVFDDNAAWVNGGILYTIEGDAPLSSDQIRRIATSLL